MTEEQAKAQKAEAAQATPAPAPAVKEAKPGSPSVAKEVVAEASGDSAPIFVKREGEEPFVVIAVDSQLRIKTAIVYVSARERVSFLGLIVQGI